MRSNYDVLEKYISLVDIRNKDLSVNKLLGVSIGKKFIPSIANTVGTDFSNYKIVRHGQFAYGPVTSRNGEKVSIALLEEDDCIISSSYTVFEITDTNQLMPEYLMLWFMRPEFDRYARYKSHGSVREIFDWEQLCNVELPVPSIEKQRNIVKAYKAITDRIALKQRINDNLFDTIKAIFAATIIEYKFASTERQASPYGEIPNGWRFVELGDLCDTVTKGTTPTTLGMDFVDSGINFVKGESIGEDHSFNKTLFAFIDKDTDTLLARSRIKNCDILFTIAGTLGKFAMADESILPANTNQAVAIIRVNSAKISPEILYTYFVGGWQTEFYKRKTQQAVQANLSLGTIKELPILLPDTSSLHRYGESVLPILASIWRNHAEVEQLNDLQNQILITLSSR